MSIGIIREELHVFMAQSPLDLNLGLCRGKEWHAL